MQEFVSINYTLFDLKLGIAYNVSQWEILNNIIISFKLKINGKLTLMNHNYFFISSLEFRSHQPSNCYVISRCVTIVTVRNIIPTCLHICVNS